MTKDLGEGTLNWLLEATQADEQFAAAAPNSGAMLKKDVGSVAINLLGSIAGEEAAVALFTFLTACVRYEEKVLEANPELALAGRARLEKHLERLDRFFEDLF